MKRRYPKSSDGRKQGGKVRKIARQALSQAAQVHLPVTVEARLELARASLATFAVEMGLQVAKDLLEAEVAQRCGRRHEHRPARSETRYGHQRGYVTMAGQKLPVRKPRVRFTDGRGEVELENYALLQSPEAMPEATLRRLVNGVSCRRYEQVVDVACEGFGVKKSSVSRGFVRASSQEVQRLAERRFDGERFAAILIDGVAYAGEMMVVALGITASGEKRLLGLRQGATENAAVCVSLLCSPYGCASSQ
jgi:transposase-like protein